MKRRLLLIGGGGHCKSVADSVTLLDSYDEIGIIDNDDIGSIAGIEKVGEDSDLPTLVRTGWNEAFVTVGSIGDTALRHKLYNCIVANGFTVPTIVDPSAIIAKDVVLEKGVYVGKNAVINAGSKVESCAIINTGAIVEHECLIGAFSHVSPGATLCGRVVVGSDSHIGAGSVVRQEITIGNNTIIGVGSVVVDNMAENVVAYGNPCRVVVK